MPFVMESTLSRRERERIMRREAMLEAARAVFAEKGFTNATIEEVAHRAEFGKGTVYNYFEKKEDLLFAIIDEMHDEVCALIDTSFAPENNEGKTFRETFRDFIEAFFGFFAKRQDLLIIAMKEVQTLVFSDEHEKAVYLMQQSNRVVEALVVPLQRAIDAGRLKPLDPVSMAHTIFGNMKGYQMHVCVASRMNPECRDQMPTPREAAEFLSTVLLDGLSAQPEPYHANPAIAQHETSL
jgi:TetR/AcrR family transcriptional regulator, repressor of fatR-cypB operon